MNLWLLHISVVGWGQEELVGLTTKPNTGAFGGDENVLHVDCGGSSKSMYICQNPNCIL